MTLDRFLEGVNGFSDLDRRIQTCLRCELTNLFGINDISNISKADPSYWSEYLDRGDIRSDIELPNVDYFVNIFEFVPDANYLQLLNPLKTQLIVNNTHETVTPPYIQEASRKVSELFEIPVLQIRRGAPLDSGIPSMCLYENGVITRQKRNFMDVATDMLNDDEAWDQTANVYGRITEGLRAMAARFDRV